MESLDYDAWVAVRAIGEAATRSKTAAPRDLIAYLKSPGFELAAFKGRKLTFRDWDGQLRQPILIGTAKLPVSVSPQPGFLHQVTELDTLGFDKPEKDNATRKEPYPCLSASPETFGHTGFTGTCVWVDPKYDLIFIFLSNRVNPVEGNPKLSNLSIRGRIQETVYQAMGVDEGKVPEKTSRKKKRKK